MNNYGNNGYNGYPQQSYGQQGYPDPNMAYGGQPMQGGPIQPLGTGNSSMKVEKELYAKAQVNGMMFAKKGSMVAYDGNLKFSKRLLGTNGGNIAGQVMNHLARKVTGENLEIMEVNGQGTCWFADNAQHVTVIDLEASGPWSSVFVESENLLAFTPQCHYGTHFIGGTGALSQKGLFTSQLSYTGPGASVAILTNGNPLVLEATPQHPVYCDPDAMICWAGQAPKMHIDVGLKTLIGQSSGESYSFCFENALVVIQPYERQSGISLRDTNRPTTQAGPSFGAGGASGTMQGASTPDIGGMAENMIKGLFK